MIVSGAVWSIVQVKTAGLRVDSLRRVDGPDAEGVRADREAE